MDFAAEAKIWGATACLGHFWKLARRLRLWEVDSPGSGFEFGDRLLVEPRFDLIVWCFSALLDSLECCLPH